VSESKRSLQPKNPRGTQPRDSGFECLNGYGVAVVKNIMDEPALKVARDAMRYRWLRERESSDYIKVLCDNDQTRHLSGSKMDAAIDRAMAAQMTTASPPIPRRGP
jgi:hypothetical protein